MPLDLNTALAQHDAREAAAQSFRTRENAHFKGFAGYSHGPLEAPTAAERLRSSLNAVRESAARAATPQARYSACVNDARRIAYAVKDEGLHAACLMACECASRGIDGEMDHAAKCLDVIDTLGGDVRAARVALADLSTEARAA